LKLKTAFAHSVPLLSAQWAFTGAALGEQMLRAAVTVSYELTP